MYNFNKIFKNSELNVKDHRQLIFILNELILENRKTFEKLPYSIQEQFGFDMYRIKLFKFEQFDNMFAKFMFSPIELNKQVAVLINTLKNLLLSNISLQVHLKVLNDREKKVLEEKVQLIKVKVAGTVVTTDESFSTSLPPPSLPPPPPPPLPSLSSTPSLPSLPS